MSGSCQGLERSASAPRPRLPAHVVHRLSRPGRRAPPAVARPARAPSRSCRGARPPPLTLACPSTANQMFAAPVSPTLPLPDKAAGPRALPAPAPAAPASLLPPLSDRARILDRAGQRRPVASTVPHLPLESCIPPVVSSRASVTRPLRHEHVHVARPAFAARAGAPRPRRPHHAHLQEHSLYCASRLGAARVPFGPRMRAAVLAPAAAGIVGDPDAPAAVRPARCLHGLGDDSLCDHDARRGLPCGKNLPPLPAPARGQREFRSVPACLLPPAGP